MEEDTHSDEFRQVRKQPRHISMVFLDLFEKILTDAEKREAENFKKTEDKYQA